MKVEVPNSNVDCVCSGNLWSFIIQMFRITLEIYVLGMEKILPIIF